MERAVLRGVHKQEICWSDSHQPPDGKVMGVSSVHIAKVTRLSGLTI